MIDERAVIDASATIGKNVNIGPWTVVGPNVEIGDDCTIASHVVLKGPTQIGKNTKIYQFSSVGEDTPDLKYKGEPTRLVIGENNVIREGVTIHRGTIQDRSETTIGDNNLIMAYCHIGHDSVLGNNCILVNNASLAGHVVVDDWVILGGYSLVHQNCRVGEHAFTGMGSAIGKDVPAYVMVAGAPGAARSINAEGLKRRGFSKDEINSLMRAFKIIYRKGLVIEDAIEELTEAAKECDKINPLIDSLKLSKRGIIR